jgi:hypothetical protein
VIPEVVLVKQLCVMLRARLSAARQDERGYSTEAVVVTALLVALAIAALGIIAAKVISKANSINTG